MNIRVLIITLITVVVLAGGTYQLLHKAPRSQLVAETGRIERDARPEPLPRPKPPIVRKSNIPPVETTPPSPRKQPERKQPKPPDPEQYWALQAKRFNRLLEQLALEQNPSRRKALIRALAAYVRSDTLSTIDWAMSLPDPNEQKAALEAIRKSSLSGIGARIEIDETGFPRIRETTVLSAIAETGLVEPGDYILGIVDTDGQPVSFENLSIQQVVKYLRGQPGSEVQLLIERLPDDADDERLIFDVSIQRSLLVIQPPY